MNTQHWFSTLGWPALLMLLMVLGAGGAIVSTLAGRYFGARFIGNRSNELVGFGLATVGGFYGLLLGFVVFLVWDDYNETESDASREGSLVKVFYRRLAAAGDQAEVEPLRAAFLVYARSVARQEYPAMKRLEPIPYDTRSSLTDLFRLTSGLKDRALSAEMNAHLRELAVNRNLRLAGAEAEIPAEIWLPLIIGMLCMLGLMGLLLVEHRGQHLLVSGVVGGFMALPLFLILLLDHPFAGPLRIEPRDYQELLMLSDPLPEQASP